MFGIPLLIAALVSLQQAVPPTEAQLQAFVDQLADIIRVETDYIPEAEKMLAAAKKARLKPERGRNGTSAAARKRAKDIRDRDIREFSDAIAESKKKIADAKAGVWEVPDLLTPGADNDSFQTLKIGDAGRMANVTASLLQIVDGGTALVAFTATASERRQLMAILKMPTAGLADDTPLDLTDGRVFTVSGTQSYTTAGGAKRTVFVLQELDMAAVRRELVKRLNP